MPSRLPDNLYAGSTVLGTSAAQIISVPFACEEVLLQADPDNIVDIMLGSPNAQVIQLLPGQEFSMTLNNMNVLWARAASGTATINWLVKT